MISTLLLRQAGLLSRSLCLFSTLLISIAAFAQDGPYTTLPYSPSLNLESMDPSVDPCADLYQYACGGWIRNHPIPPARAG